tara:strand:+ start:36410 stop:39862 length:3453 start_codon:yes stop_codon:yes gene_type:complete
MKYFYITLILLFTSCSNNELKFTQQQIDQLFMSKNLGLAYIEESKLEDAEKEFEKILNINPNEAMGYGNLALIYFRLGQLDKAKFLIKKSENLNDENSDIKLINSEILLAENKYEEAIKILEKSLIDSPKNIRVLFKLAEIYGLLFQINNNEDDLIARTEYLKKIIDLEYINLAILIQYIESNFRIGNLKNAKYYFESLYQLLPELNNRESNLVTQIYNEIFEENVDKALRFYIGFSNLMKTKNRYQADLDEIKSQGLTLVGFPIENFLSKDFIFDISKSNSFNINFENSILIDLSNRFDIIEDFLIEDLNFDGINEIFVTGKFENKIKSEILSFKNYKNPSIVFEETTLSKINSFNFNDLDNNGFLDLIISFNNETRIYYNNGELKFSEKFILSKGFSTNKSIFGDFDHDGDLDIFQLNNGKNVFLRNNSDGTFLDNSQNLNIKIDDINTIDGDISDFDHDGDLDLVLINSNGTINLLSNERHGKFVDKGKNLTLDSNLSFIQTQDLDNDGFFDFLIQTENKIKIFKNFGNWNFINSINLSNNLQSFNFDKINIYDFNNDSKLDILNSAKNSIFHLETDETYNIYNLTDFNNYKNNSSQILDFDLDGKIDLVFSKDKKIEIFRNTSKNLNKYINVKLNGLRVGSGKNNYFGIGSKIEIKSGTTYQTKIVKNNNTHFGLNDDQLDVMRIVWTNGYPQNVINPELNQYIVEKQELKGSCPYLYAWNGTKFEFVKDIFWRNALGMPLGIMSSGDMAYAFHHSTDEYVKIPGKYLKTKDENYFLKVSMELWETAYYDNIRLHVIDHPKDTYIYVDEKFLPYPKLEKKIFSFSNKKYPISVFDDKGNDLLKYIIKKDYNFISNLTPSKYQGTTKLHDLIIDLGKVENKNDIKLYLHGWLFPTDASLNVKISQEKTFSIKSPSIQVLDENNEWVTIEENIFFPNGKDKTCIIDLSNKFLSDKYKIKISTSMAIYWDEIFFTENDNNIELVETILNPIKTELEYRGYSKKYLQSNISGLDYPSFYEVEKFPKWRDLKGNYTKYGDVNSLVIESDNKYVIMNSGDVMTIKFPTNFIPKLKDGWTRDFLLYSDGWLKDGDMNTLTGNTSNPMPFHQMKGFPDDSSKYFFSDELIEYNKNFNTRIIDDTNFRNHIKKDD